MFFELRIEPKKTSSKEEVVLRIGISLVPLSAEIIAEGEGGRRDKEFVTPVPRTAADVLMEGGVV